MDYFLGEIRLFSFDYAPRDWALCNGAVLPMQQYVALYALLGVQFGGDGKTTFALPDLRGRAPLASGKGPSGTVYTQGIAGAAGSEGVVLTAANMPLHNHMLAASTAFADQYLPSSAMTPTPGYVLAEPPMDAAATPSTPFLYGVAPNPDATLAGDSLGMSGAGVAHDNMQPFLVLNYCIATQGLFPSRN